MRIQPRGFKRISTSSTLLLKIRKQIELIAARYDCSKSFVIATLLAKQLGIDEQVNYDEINAGTKTRINYRGRETKINRTKSRERYIN